MANPLDYIAVEQPVAEAREFILVEFTPLKCEIFLVIHFGLVLKLFTSCYFYYFCHT